MKVPASIRSIYTERLPLYEKLKTEIDKQIHSWKDERWHYESRIKTEESFALKVESGRFSDPSNLEDWFGATIVVPNLNAVSSVEKILRSRYGISERRPRKIDRTHKDANSFPFDDLRIYASIKPDDRYPETELEGIVFEIQIKTFLQHAWSIATHDLVYKGDNITWSSERIAFQVKAMLEHAEVSIAEADALSRSENLAKTTKTVENINKIASLIRDIWGDQLPSDLKRVASLVHELIQSIQLSIPKLSIHLKEYFRSIGGVPENLSPYLSVIECLISRETRLIMDFLAQPIQPYSKLRIVITSEVRIPEGVALEGLPRLIYIGAQKMNRSEA